MKAAIIHSGGDLSSPDNQDTLIQSKEIEGWLKSVDIQTTLLAFEDNLDELRASLKILAPDFIFNLVETFGGTDGLMYFAAGYFEYLKIPYTGCSAQSLSLLASKIQQKSYLRLAGLPTPDFMTLDSLDLAGGPWIVKSATEHASLGITSENVVETAPAAKLKILERQEVFGGIWFAERFIEGREFNLSILEGLDGQPEVLAPAEILFKDYPDVKPQIVDYEAKWDPDSHAYHGTFRSLDFEECDGDLIKILQAHCHQCWQLFALNGAARVDFRVDSSGQPWILEVNPNPCLASDAGFMAAAKRTNLSPTEVITRLLPRNCR